MTKILETAYHIPLSYRSIEKLSGKLTKKASEYIVQPTQPTGGEWFYCCCCYLFVCLDVSKA